MGLIRAGTAPGNAWKRALRAFVMRTARAPGLSAIYRAYYRLAVLALVRLAARTPEIERLYAVRSFAANTWVPGYSDIDLFCTIRRMSPDREVEWLHATWRKIDRIRDLFPMLGSFQIATAAELDLWKAHGGARREEQEGWVTLYDRR